MMAAEEWRRYQESYIKYGIDLQPEITPSVKPARREKSKIKATAREKAVILFMVLAVALCMVATVSIHAYAASIKYNINSLNRELDNLSNDIDNLNVKIRSGNNLDSIEYYAVNDLGMVYPGLSQTVDVTGMADTDQVNAYIAGLTASQRGFVVRGNITVAEAAHLLFAQS